RALTILESLRAKAPTNDLRTSYRAEKQKYYEFYIDLLMQLHEQHPADGFDVLAFEASQRGRAQSLLELLAEARINLRRDLAIEQQNREDAIFKKSSSIQKQLWSEGLPPNRRQMIKKELSAAEDELKDFPLDLRRENPRYSEIQYPRPINLAKVQNELLDPDTAIIEFALGEKRSLAWVLTQKELRSFI